MLNAKYALVVVGSRRYLPGVSAIINALDYYGTDVDVKYLWWPQDFEDHDEVGKHFFKALAEVKGMLSCDVEVIDLDKYLRGKNPKGTRGWQCKFSGYLYASELQSYDAVALFGADVLPLRDLTPWFQVADKTGLMVMGINAKGSRHFVFDRQTVANATASAPYTTVPLFLKPSLYKDFLRYVWAFGLAHEVGDMISFNYAVDKFDPPKLTQPDLLWVRNNFNVDLVNLDEVDGKKHVITKLTHEHLWTIHNKYWSPRIVGGYVKKTADIDKDLTRHNLGVFQDMYNFFNNERSLKLHADWMNC